MIKLIPFLVASTLILTSCSSNQTEAPSAPQQKLLESYSLKRDANGAYSIDLKTTNYTDVTSLKNSENTNEIILSEASNKTAKKYSNNFLIENEQLVIGFLDANKGNRKKITIEDQNSNLSKRNITEFLNSYSVTENNDGTYLLSFKVNNNVATTFTYNQEIATYEVHLSEGNTTQKDFSETIALSPNENTLRIDFVNHKYSTINKGITSSRKAMGAYGRKPRIIIVNGND
ncbi:hypothetical protein LNI96_09885 [Tenacibaculum dicentrarchi]|nr:hypothetical protein [Tenacibaculum dicentrarchi]MCD8408228.1 hypothetical protein [Tenacibaculum dicentrarchi]MCD8425833.1 hypothetical protein [Tenacibaculum dicentrarchi]MCD8435753.1 hypothetical protein [Tenacibaculum dicentrarchi]MCD8442876.1 hypothetical protein [Tenacibaculum dicentrarchi]